MILVDTSLFTLLADTTINNDAAWMAIAPDPPSFESEAVAINGDA